MGEMSKPDRNAISKDLPLISGDNPYDYLIEAWKVVLDLIDEGVTIHSQEGKVIFANEKVAEFYGVAAEDLLGLNYDDVLPVADVTSRNDTAFLSDDEIRDFIIQVRGKRLRVLMKPLTAIDGTNRGYIRIVSDVTEQNVNSTLDQKEDQIVILGQMIASLVHDVGTPLNIISGYAEYLLMRTDSEGKGYKELSTILQQTRRVSEFIKQLLNVTNPQSRQSIAISIETVLRESLDLAGHYLRKKSINTSLNCNTQLPLIKGDVFGLRQAFFKILISICETLCPESSVVVSVKPASDNESYIDIEFDLRDKTGGEIESSRLLAVACNSLAEYNVKVGQRELDGEGTALHLKFPKQNNS